MIAGISRSLLNLKESALGRKPFLDDLFTLVEPNNDLKELILEKKTNFEVVPNYLDLIEYHKEDV